MHYVQQFIITLLLWSLLRRKHNKLSLLSRLFAKEKKQITTIDQQPRQHTQGEKDKEKKMGQAMRMISYDYAGNRQNAISSLELAGNTLKWFRLDDGVMGGRSETQHQQSDDGRYLHFQGTINTNGGGFASIRAPIVPAGSVLTSNVIGLKFLFRGDGKTYKVLLSEGNAGPFGRSPSWQVDLDTTAMTGDDDKEWQETCVLFSDLLPSFGGRPSSSSRSNGDFQFDINKMQELGLMLSLKLSNGTPNPQQTFGIGIFPFHLIVKSIQPIYTKDK